MTPRTDAAVQAASYAGAGTSVIAGLTLTDIGVIIGIVTAILTLAFNVIYQVRKDRREQRIYKLEVERLSGKKSQKGSARTGMVVGAGLLAVVAGLATPLIQHFEGQRLAAYSDAVGIPTICAGITVGVHLGDVATPRECDERLQAELRQRLVGLQGCIHKDLAPNQWAAVLSFAYNVGVPAACGSTMVSMINAGEPPSEWCAQLDRWVYAGGQKLAGLERRRAAERKLCEQQ